MILTIRGNLTTLDLQTDLTVSFSSSPASLPFLSPLFPPPLFPASLGHNPLTCCPLFAPWRRPFTALSFACSLLPWHYAQPFLVPFTAFTPHKPLVQLSSEGWFPPSLVWSLFPATSFCLPLGYTFGPFFSTSRALQPQQGLHLSTASSPCQSLSSLSSPPLFCALTLDTLTFTMPLQH